MVILITLLFNVQTHLTTLWIDSIMDYDSANTDMTSKVYSLVINRISCVRICSNVFTSFFRFAIKNINKQLMFSVIKIKVNLVYEKKINFSLNKKQISVCFSVDQHCHYWLIVTIIHKILHKPLIVMNNWYKSHRKLMIINSHLDNHFINVVSTMKLFEFWIKLNNQHWWIMFVLS